MGGLGEIFSNGAERRHRDLESEMCEFHTKIRELTILPETTVTCLIETVKDSRGARSSHGAGLRSGYLRGRAAVDGW